MLSSWYHGIDYLICTFLHFNCEFVFKEYWALKPDENLQEVGLHGGVIECSGEVLGEEATG